MTRLPDLEPGRCLDRPHPVLLHVPRNRLEAQRVLLGPVGLLPPALELELVGLGYGEQHLRHGLLMDAEVRRKVHELLDQAAAALDLVRIQLRLARLVPVLDEVRRHDAGDQRIPPFFDIHARLVLKIGAAHAACTAAGPSQNG
eukprot:1865680-Pyramimonas_sp.AAC.1